MSRIGRKPVPIPDKVEVRADGQRVSVKGPLGSLTQVVPPEIAVSVTNSQVEIRRLAEGRHQRALHGLVRTEIRNMIQGVTEGFERVLEINGVGYKANLAGRAISFNLGYTHAIEFPLPEGIDAKVDKQTIVTIKGRDKALVGQTAANIRALKKPDVYKAKGIKYSGEILIRKEGKTGK
jgi:large subunit ribosomal protein L6